MIRNGRKITNGDMLRSLILSIMTFLSVSCFAQKPAGHRLPNIGWSMGHHLPDSTTCSQFNIGLLSEVDTLRGAQIATVYGGIRGEAQGLMVAGLANAAHSLRGIQLAALTNIVFTPIRGMQLGAMTNIALGVSGGLQLAAAANISSGDMRGAQIAAFNYADTLHGTQIGLINAALRHPDGWQIGLINYTTDTIAHKIGLVNINPKTHIDFMGFLGNSAKLNGAIRFRNRSTYSIFGIGTHYMGFDEDFSGAIFYRVGQYLRLSHRWSLSADLGFFHIETFHKNSVERPARLYSLQARVNLDYQITPFAGAFVSAGYGTTRYYTTSHNYRTRPIIEGGLTFAYRHNAKQESQWVEEKLRDYDYMLGKLNETPEEKLYRFTDPEYTHDRWGRAAIMATAINVGVHGFDRFVMGEDFAKVNFSSIARNWRNAFVWDNDQFSTNLFAHPYHGNLYFNSARSNGLSFWQSAPYALGGSLMWEFCGEVEPPAINDLMATTMGGIAIGEIAHRISALILNDRSRGFRRFLREAAATAINPMQGLTRIINGDAWNVRQERYLYHDYTRIPVECTVSVGTRYLADNGGLFRGEQQPYVNLYLNYGDPFDDEDQTPYNYFSTRLTMGFTGNQPIISQLHLMGKIWGQTIYDGRQGKTLFGIFQHFNYYDSKPVKDGTRLTPYRISEAAALGPGLIWQFPHVGALAALEQRIFTDFIMLGGTKSDYYNVIDRDYNMGSGFSIKSNTLMDFPHLGRFVLNIDYYRIYTWKGYEGKNLNTVDPLYLNAQGDRGNAQLIVVNPMLLLQLKHNVGIEFSGSYYGRHTHYKYHDKVVAQTFEVKAGLVVRL